MCERQRKRESRRRANVLLVCRGSRSQSRTNIIIHYIFYFIFSSSLSRSLSRIYIYLYLYILCIYDISAHNVHSVASSSLFRRQTSFVEAIYSIDTNSSNIFHFFFEYLYLCLFPVHFPLLSFSSCVRVSKQREACDKFWTIANDMGTVNAAEWMLQRWWLFRSSAMYPNRHWLRVSVCFRKSNMATLIITIFVWCIKRKFMCAGLGLVAAGSGYMKHSSFARAMVSVGCCERVSYVVRRALVQIAFYSMFLLRRWVVRKGKQQGFVCSWYRING